ncbi:hypothetical protein IG193_08710 [Infirmifilum lucidum]|uniref:CRISPR type III-associated protein domain-containing protein n=1 Tax=Infirmifilum lucidum TaxID=2776706 RepID=A0A7L9FIG3_9CREN|nr:RAMP superfamily CRISPR-associated protein [Infirmifilum lucidum]QOJ78813.1 hypothetical protein IG193_08710 [Infirmifilum lucidum]
MWVRLYKFTFRAEPLRVGAGVDGSRLLQLAYSYGDGKPTPVVPFSTWKGVFRRVSEWVMYSDASLGRVLEEHGCNHDLRKCGLDGEPCTDKLRDLYRKYSECVDAWSRGGREEDACLEVEPEVLHNVNIASKVDERDFCLTARGVESALQCPVCRLYGSPYFASAVTFSDSLLRGLLRAVTHVAIDRKTRIQREDMLYIEELAEPEEPREVQVYAVLREAFPDPKPLEVWTQTLRVLAEVGVFVGGGKSRGHGYVQLDPEKSLEARLRPGEGPAWRKLSL